MIALDDQLDEKYEVLEKIRVGGMGAIYKVRHRLLDEVRIVKTIRRPGASAEVADRFLREARAATRLRHPNVANLYDFAVGSDGRAYIIMEYIEGWDLQEVLRGYGPPPLPLTLEIAQQSLRALGYLHRLKILHRDISPDNLMLTWDVDGKPLVKLIDLGIAKALQEEQAVPTTTGAFVGKPRYGSPERFNGETLDERSDLYSFGVVLYELLTGCCPIAGTETAALMAGHLFLPPRDFAQTDPEGRVPEALRAVVLRALAKRPEERMASAGELMGELARIQDEYPLEPEAVRELWQLLRPGPPESAATRAGSWSAKTPLAIPLAMARALAAGRFVTPQLAPAGGPAGPAFAAFHDTRATSRGAARETAEADAWASRPVRSAPAAGEAAEPMPARTRVRALWATGAVAALGLLLWGGWRASSPLQPVPPPRRLPAPRPAPVAPPASAVWALSEPAVAVAAPAPAEPAEPAEEAEEKTEKPATRREPIAPAIPAAPVPAVHRPASVPRRPMRRGDMILRSDMGVAEPEIRFLPHYSYPAADRGSGRRVTLRIAVLVDENGRAIEARVRDGGAADRRFQETALAAARRTRFFPPLRNGIPGKMWTELLFAFAE